MTPDEALTAPISAPNSAELRLPSGLRARVEGEEGGERLEVRDARGRAVLTLHDDGTVELASARDLVLRAQGEVRIEGGTSVRLDGPEVRVSAARLVQRLGELETRATHITERARSTYRFVEELAQLRARNVRTVASDAVRLLGERLRLKAREDVKVRAEQIHLG